jgi:hypothetical protein
MKPLYIDWIVEEKQVVTSEGKEINIMIPRNETRKQKQNRI